MKLVPLIIIVTVLILAGWQPALWLLGGYLMGLITAGWMVGRGEI